MKYTHISFAKRVKKTNTPDQCLLCRSLRLITTEWNLTDWTSKSYGYRRDDNSLRAVWYCSYGNTSSNDVCTTVLCEAGRSRDRDAGMSIGVITKHTVCPPSQTRSTWHLAQHCTKQLCLLPLANEVAGSWRFHWRPQRGNGVGLYPTPRPIPSGPYPTPDVDIWWLL